jgi:hypothetical protein
VFKYKKIAVLVFSLAISPSFSQSLCAKNEIAVFSFQEEKSKKLASICKEKESKYLVYRFGTAERVELEFPSSRDKNSWKKFKYSGRERNGGKQNVGFGDYTLSFRNGPAEYYVFQEWDDEAETYSIGINIHINGKSRTLFGSKSSQVGSLVLLDSENTHLRNCADK